MDYRLKILFIINLAVSLGFAVSDAYFSLYAGSIGARGLMFAFAVGGYFAAKIFFSPFTGMLCDKIGSGRMIMASTAVYSIIALSYVFFNDLLIVTALRILQGLAAAMFRPVILASAGSLAPRTRRASSMGAFDISFYAATAAGPLLGGIIRDTFGFSGLFLLLSALCISAFAASVLYALDAVERVSSDEDGTSFSDVIKNPVVAALLAFIFGRAFTISALCIFLPIYLEQTMGLSPFRTGIVMSLSTIVMIVFLRPMGVLADRYPKNLMIISGGLYTGMLLVFLPLVESYYGILLICGLVGVFSAMSQPACSALLIEEGERMGLGKTAGVFNGALNLGFAVAPFAGSLIHSFLGIRFVFYFAGVSAMLAMLVSSYLMISFSPVEADV
ncbi:MFS transporter [Seleniivibrio sp.]|uniref:MFS transporter n=1 Tax=Seleniivibrio sp. TaxID=2898801 RepID=UPI0025DB40CC|nr:MFS transporter [Seleniivibrio sp.]MCD8554767.1 MFS transporter [Seleniivibrio sp.]